MDFNYNNKSHFVQISFRLNEKYQNTSALNTNTKMIVETFLSYGLSHVRIFTKDKLLHWNKHSHNATIVNIEALKVKQQIDETMPKLHLIVPIFTHLDLRLWVGKNVLQHHLWTIIVNTTYLSSIIFSSESSTHSHWSVLIQVWTDRWQHTAKYNSIVK